MLAFANRDYLNSTIANLRTSIIKRGGACHDRDGLTDIESEDVSASI